MSLTKEAVETLLQELIGSGDIMECSQYGEPGYSLEEGKIGILLSNWNNYDQDFQDLLEESYELEWDDMWIIDYNSDKVYRTVGDSYGWQQAYRITEDGELITPDNDPADWIEFCKIDDPQMPHRPHSLPSFITEEDLETEGFELIDGDLQNGWYDRNDDPQEVLEEALNNGYSEVVFRLEGVGQFAIDFSIYGKK